jgi:hypothetical protein
MHTATAMQFSARRKAARGGRESLGRSRNWPLVHEMFAAEEGGTGDATSDAASVTPEAFQAVRGFTANKPDPE